ncbi:BLUF domain-containing protein [Aquimarina spongiae]|uniref:Sensors of blue-light using FAD n=1 Tax=Aquimarina spongiae TaxID=570521 RepID=A0A1M6KZT5_9FLAO|nr:BLUF domain-containing protein [Aquimarina spongiae]SHJ64402.1 Sensors of blue-light using FAD [Aquimarina spongiae]
MRHTICYVSTVSPDVSDTMLSEIMAHVKQNNSKLDITGILMHSEGNFFQVLEGEKEVILPLFHKIKEDRRHYNVIKILDKEINNSTFTEYHSSFAVISSQSGHKELQHFLKRLKTNNPEHFKSISYLTQKFMKLS